MSDDLVQRLHTGIHGRQTTDLLEEAADRIEALERAIWTMHGEANKHIKRIEELEKRWDLQVDNAVRMAAERIEALEAALRWYAELDLDIAERARRALEEKP